MCDTIRTKEADIETIEQFEKHFNVSAEDFKYDDTDVLVADACLCQIDLDKFMLDKKDRFEQDCGDWWEL